VIRSGGSGGSGPDGVSGGVAFRSSVDGGYIGEEGSECGREPGLAEREKELSRRRHSSTFRHSA
jgi:hypothetical protein